MTAVPERIAKLPKDKRGYPVPWNVLCAEDGTPFFTVNDDRKHWKALRMALCPICGESLGRWKWWVGGPRSAFDPNGWYMDLPGHMECMQFSLATCPYLALPKYLGRIDVPDSSKLPPIVLVDITQIPERPPLFVAVAGDKLEVRGGEGPMLPYTRPQHPVLGYEFWRQGKCITDEEAMPLLRDIFGRDWVLPELVGGGL